MAGRSGYRGALALPFLFYVCACSGRNCSGTPAPTPSFDAASAAPAPSAAAPPRTAIDASALAATDAGSFVRSDTCELTLDADREATRDEILALVVPAYHDGELPVHHAPPRAGQPASDLPFVVEPCLGPPRESLSRPALGRMDRLALDAGRELVQFPVGTQAGLVEFTSGLRALLARSGRAVRVLAIDEVAGDLTRGLEPYRKGKFGAADVVLQPWAAGPETEQYETGSYVSVYVLRGVELRMLGWMTEQRASHDPFWQGKYDWTMTSPGIEPDDAGFVVREHWSFTHGATHKVTTRDVARKYRIDKDALVTVPPFRPEAWPETTPAPPAP